jgi:diguanylate cyclase (GGDEF)-like protein
MLLIDVDSFKGFNDLYGHSAGDAALIEVARCITNNLRRPGDTAARYGGEEFAVLLPDTDEAGAMNLAEQIRAAIQERGVRHVASSHHVLTVSIGIACTSGQIFATARELINAADEALYEAKDAGRNRTVAYGTATQAPGGDTGVPGYLTPEFSPHIYR